MIHRTAHILRPSLRPTVFATAKEVQRRLEEKGIQCKIARTTVDKAGLHTLPPDSDSGKLVVIANGALLPCQGAANCAAAQ